MILLSSLSSLAGLKPIASPHGAPEDNPSRAYPLALARTGEALRIVAVRAGKGLERRLGDLGLPIGARIELLFRDGSGRVVVGRGHSRVALGASLAHGILVSPSSADP